MKKVLIIAAGIHQENGTGVTLMNLFASLPKEQICFVLNPRSAMLTFKCGYRNIFVVSKNIHGAISSIYDSDFLTRIVATTTSDNDTIVPKPKSSKIRTILKNISSYIPIFEYYKQNSFHRILPGLKDWLKVQNPTSIYAVGSMIPLTIEIKKHLNVRLVTHIMDDWISTDVKKGFLSSYLKWRIRKDFAELLKLSDIHIAVSEKMAVEYNNRYGYEWKVNHNPLVVEKWFPYQKTKYNSKRNFSVAFFGRITNPNHSIIEQFSKIIELLGPELGLEFHIYSDKSGVNSSYVTYYEFLPHDMLPMEMGKHDLLLLPFLFDEFWTRYARLSMPTKISEYLITGVPVYLISPPNTAVAEFCKNHNCAITCESTNDTDLANDLSDVVRNPKLREEVASNGKRIAMQMFNAETVSNEFLALFS